MKIDDQYNELSSEHLKKMFQQNPMLTLCLDRFEKAKKFDEKYFSKIDIWRKTGDSVDLENETNSVAGQLTVPHLRKLFKGMNHPEGKLQGKGGIPQDHLIFAESYVREKTAVMKKLWKHNRNQLKKDGMIYLVMEVNPEGEWYFTMKDRKKIIFDEHAEHVHSLTEGVQGAVWRFGMDIVRGESFRSKYKSYGDVVKKVKKGNPVECTYDILNEENMKTTETDDDDVFGDDVVVLNVSCLSSPMDMEVKVGDKKIKIKQGEPFFVRFAGGNATIISCLTGEDWIFRWQHKKTKKHPLGEPFHPVIPFWDTQFKKKLQCISFFGFATPYVTRISSLEDKIDKYVALHADPDYVLNFKKSGIGGSGGNDDGADDQVKNVKEWVALNLRKKLEGKKSSNFILTDTEDGVDIDLVQATPTNLNIDQVENRLQRLKTDFSDLVGVLHNDTSYSENAKVGILEYKEEEQNGAVASWQELNENEFALFDMMILNNLFIFQSDFSDDEIEIKDRGVSKKGFAYKKRLSDLKNELSPEILNLEWKFAFSRPDGALQANMERYAFEQMDLLIQRFGALPTVEKAMLNSVAKQISLENGTETFSAEEAWKEIQQSRQKEAQVENEEPIDVDQFDENQIMNYLTS